MTYSDFAPCVPQQNTPIVLFIAPGAEDFYEIARHSASAQGIQVLQVDAIEHESGLTNGWQHGETCSPLLQYHMDPYRNMPDWEFGPERWDCDQPNLASFGVDVVLPRIKDLIRQGRGPSAVVCGSRGGDVTIIKVWEQWRGPTLILNGSPLRAGLVSATDDMQSWYHVPEEVPLYLALGGNDFYFRDHLGLPGCFSEFVPSQEHRLQQFQTGAPIPLWLKVQHIFLYYHPTDGHGLQSLRHGDLLSCLLAFIVRKDLRNVKTFRACIPKIPDEAEVWSIDRSAGAEQDFIGMQVREYEEEGVKVTKLCGEDLRLSPWRVFCCFHWCRRRSRAPQRGSLDSRLIDHE